METPLKGYLANLVPDEVKLSKILEKLGRNEVKLSKQKFFKIFKEKMVYEN